MALVVEKRKVTLGANSPTAVSMTAPRPSGDIYICISATQFEHISLPAEASSWELVTSAKVNIGGLRLLKIHKWEGNNEPSSYQVEHGNDTAAFIIFRVSGGILADIEITYSVFSEIGSNVTRFLAYIGEKQYNGVPEHTDTINYGTWELTITGGGKKTQYSEQML
jgi:hypothetical protein